MDARQEHDTHTEVDRELGLVFRNDHDFEWWDHESATDCRHIHYGGRVQGNEVALNSGTTVRAGRNLPTSPSHLYHPKHTVWGVPAGKPPLPDTQVLTERHIEGSCIPSVLAPSDDVLVGPAPSTRQQHKANSSPLVDSDMFSGLGELKEKSQQRLSGRHHHRHDEDGSGIAVARARHRLKSFRTARQNVSTNVNSDHGHENVPSPLPEDQRARPTSQDEAKAMLGRLKEMRCAVLA